MPEFTGPGRQDLPGVFGTSLPTWFPGNHDNVVIMVSRILALFVWAAVAASVAYWGLRWLSKPMAVPPGTSSVALNTAPQGDIVRLFKAPKSAETETAPQEQQSALAARIQVLGVVAPRAGQVGVALMAVDGKPPRAYRIGAAVDGEQVVQAITQQSVQIGPVGGTAAVNLSLPLLPPPATGSLPPAGGFSPPSAAPAAYTPPPSVAVPQAMPPTLQGDTSATERPRRLPARLRRQQMQQQMEQQQMQPGNATEGEVSPST